MHYAPPRDALIMPTLNQNFKVALAVVLHFILALLHVLHFVLALLHAAGRPGFNPRQRDRQPLSWLSATLGALRLLLDAPSLVMPPSGHTAPQDSARLAALSSARSRSLDRCCASCSLSLSPQEPPVPNMYLHATCKNVAPMTSSCHAHVAMSTSTSCSATSCT